VLLVLAFSHATAAAQAAPTGAGVSAEAAQSLVDARVASGVSGIVALTVSAGAHRFHPATRLYAFLDDHVLRRQPGAMYEYSNLGAGLLGHVLALRGGMSYEQLVIERILDPLGLEDTRITPTASMQQRLATGHNAMGAPAGNWHFDVLAGAGGRRSTPADQCRLLAAGLAPPPGTLGQAFDLAAREHARTDADPVRIGLGWHLLRRGEQTIVWHNGRTAGYYAFIGYDAAAGTAAAVLSASSRSLDDLGLGLLPPR
jgi:serine-type D-Ala-D-Ala carboxypeptidase/endopeptidase